MLSQMVALAAGGPTGAAFKDYVLVVAGNIFIIIFVVRAIGYYGKREWGEMVGHVLAGIIIAGFVYANNTTIGILKSLWNTFAGS